MLVDPKSFTAEYGGNQFIGVVLSHGWTMKKYNTQTKSHMLAHDVILFTKKFSDWVTPD